MIEPVYQENTVEVATVENIGVVAVAQRTTLQIGEPRITGIRAFIRNTYPAAYNHVVRNMNHLHAHNQIDTKEKRAMRGGHFLLYRYILLLAMLCCFCFGIASLYVKPCAVVPFILTVLYIALSIYNIVVYMRNRPLIHPTFARQVPRGQISGGFLNEFYAVPLNATVLTGVIAAFIDPAVVAAAIKRENLQLTEIEIMLYDDRYLRHSRFPREAVVHIIIFFILFVLAIVFVGSTVSK